jgi:FkbM family methyltransferase
MNWRFGRRRGYRVGKFDLELTGDHALPKYQAQFSTYDRFLPVLAKQLTSQSTVVDVGANVGDTVASIASANPSLHFLAVEPDPVFSELLRNNITRMLSAEPGLAIEVVQALIADDLAIVGLEGGRGTSHAVVDDQSGKSAPFATMSLDDLLLPRKPEGVSLIKSDTDGFDWSVIDSGRSFFAEFRPMVYFECEVGKRGEYLEKYSKALGMLLSNGYVDFHVFDNFGGYLGLFYDSECMKGLMRYVAAQNAGRIHRTLYYMDILAVAREHTSAAAKAVNSFTCGYLI